MIDTRKLIGWINAHCEELATSEWYEDNFNGNTMENITPAFFIETYLKPLIESNIQYDFGIVDIDIFEVKR